MGQCASDETAEEKARKRAEATKSKQIDTNNQKESTQDRTVNKLLLLGAGESGKSTIFKQITSLYGQDSVLKENRNGQLPIICNNIVVALGTLIQKVDELGGGLRTQAAKEAYARVSTDINEDSSTEEESLTPDKARDIAILWVDEGIQRTYEQRSKFQLYDSAKYFFDKVEDLASPNYEVTELDVLSIRVRTTGIVETRFELDGNFFRVFDVGGQRNERKKWIHCFEGVTAVVFVAALSEYDQVLFEDEQTNRMDEAINLFEEICNSQWFSATSMMLFLNKSDLFQTKLPLVPLNTYFTDYKGDNSFKSACEFIRDAFEARNREKDKAVYTHVTCARDKNNVHVVFDAVKDILIRDSLNQAGLV